MNDTKNTGMLVILFCAAFIAAFNENIINVGLTDIMAEFNIGANTVNWLVTGYMIITAIVVTAMAFLLRRFKLRSLFFAASATFVLGSILAYFAPTYPLLLAFRLLQAVGTGIFIPAMMSTVLAVAPRKKLGAYLAIGSCCITFGPAFGPVISGIMVTFFGWRTMFLVPMIVMAIVMIAGFFFMKNLNKSEKIRLDMPSLLMSILGLTAVVYGLSEITGDLFMALIALALGVVAIVVFVVRQGRIENPLLNLAPMKNFRFATSCALVVVAMMTTFSMSVLLPLYFMGAVQMTAFAAGALVLIPILAQAGMAFFGGRIMDRRGEWPLLPLGFLLVTVGQVTVAWLAGGLSLMLVVLAATIVYAGVGLTFSPSQTAGLKRLSSEMNPYGVSIMSTFIQVAGALGPSLFVGILSSTMADSISLGIDEFHAQAAGFSSAVLVAAAIAAAGCIVSFVYARKLQHEQIDIVAKSASQTTAIPSMLCLDQVMKSDVYTISNNAAVFEAAQAMIEHHTSGLPVVDTRSRVVGFISDGDILKALSDQDSPLIDLSFALTAYTRDENFDERIETVMRLNVEELATSHVVGVTADDSLARVCTVLGEKRIKKVPVLEKGRLIGTVSRSDVTRALFASFVTKGQTDSFTQ